MTDALLVTGTVGSGKTATADAIGDLLRGWRIPHAVIDLDWLRWAWPSPPDDPFQSRLELANLAAVARNMVEAGAERLVLAGVIEQASARAAYEVALGRPFTICRLRVGLDRVEARLVARHPEGSTRSWHVDRSAPLHRTLEQNGIGDVVVDVGEEGPEQVAQAVVHAVGWRPPSAGARP